MESLIPEMENTILCVDSLDKNSLVNSTQEMEVDEEKKTT